MYNTFTLLLKSISKFIYEKPTYQILNTIQELIKSNEWTFSFNVCVTGKVTTGS